MRVRVRMHVCGAVGPCISQQMSMASLMKLATCLNSFEPNPRVVMAGVPMRTPANTDTAAAGTHLLALTPLDRDQTLLHANAKGLLLPVSF